MVCVASAVWDTEAYIGCALPGRFTHSAHFQPSYTKTADIVKVLQQTSLSNSSEKLAYNMPSTYYLFICSKIE